MCSIFNSTLRTQINVSSLLDNERRIGFSVMKLNVIGMFSKRHISAIPNNSFFVLSDINYEYFIQNSLCLKQIFKPLEKKYFQFMLNNSSKAKTCRQKFMDNPFESALCTEMSVKPLTAVKYFKVTF